MFPNCTFNALYCERLSAKKEKISALQLRFISATIAVKIGEVCTWNRKSCWRRCTQRKKLKDTTRHCYTSKGRHESVAEHSWRIALMAFWLRDEFPQADMDKVIRMCLIHDLGECFTGDIPAFDKTAADEAAEEALLSRWVDSLPEPVCTEMRTLYAEMAALQTTEAKIYKALDKMEAIVQHNESAIATWEPQEYALNLTYGVEQSQFSPYMQALREAIRQETLRKMEQEGATPQP